MTLPALTVSPDMLAEARSSKAWPFEEARKLVKRFDQSGYPEVAIFETGYGPSGLPHIGTFGEVARTSMVRHAFRVLTEDKVATRIICFSDDLDGMRKVPGNVPNADMLAEYIDIPLSRVPNPFGSEHPSFAHHNNAKLREFLDGFGFDYEFASSTDYYESGRFDDALRTAAERYQDIMDVMLPTLGEERQATYSPFLPISPETGKVLYVPMKHVDAKEGTVTFDDSSAGDRETTLPVTGGAVKLQWKPDFGMRFAALNVHYEMFGKDHQANSVVYDRICRILGQRPPEHYVYELFLDAAGEKISKTKGNGISIDEWLTYASPESLAYFMYMKPRTAKRLHFDVIPKAVDEYYTHAGKYDEQDWKTRLSNPAFHIHAGAPEHGNTAIPFSMLLNLVSASGAQDAETLWGFIGKYAPDATPQNNPPLDGLIGYALRYGRDFVIPNKSFRAPTDLERSALEDLSARLGGIAGSGAKPDGETLQTEVFTVGKEHAFENIRDWFSALYQVLLGEDQGPRFGSFIALYGVPETKALIDRALAGELLADASAA
ncbi:MAG: lysine--tRNA ligase [Pseudomonadota bacterium]